MVPDADPGAKGEGTGADMVMDTLAGFARTLAHGYEVTDVLHDLTDRIRTVLGITGAGVSLLRGDRLGFVTSDSEAMASLEKVQEEHQQGPCVDAARSGAVVSVADVALFAERWPVYAAHAAEVGVRAVAGIPMRLNGSTIGAVDLCDAAPRRWSDRELATARVFSDIATSYVINASQLDQQRRTAEQLHRALESRIVIEQAKGIISAHHRVSVDEAFQVLRKHSNDHHASLRATADAVVNLGLRP